jgi:hypothetical protein
MEQINSVWKGSYVLVEEVFFVSVFVFVCCVRVLFRFGVVLFFLVSCFFLLLVSDQSPDAERAVSH